MRYQLTLVPEGTNEPESTIEIGHHGEPTMSIECAAGTLHADIESARNTNHNAIYIRFTPKGCTDSIDIAALKDTKDPNTLELFVWDDITSEDPALTIPFDVDDIVQVLT